MRDVAISSSLMPPGFYAELLEAVGEPLALVGPLTVGEVAELLDMLELATVAHHIESAGCPCCGGALEVSIVEPDDF